LRLGFCSLRSDARPERASEDAREPSEDQGASAGNLGFEDRQDLLGHKSHGITTHYSGAEPANLIAAAESVCDETPTILPQSPDFDEVRERYVFDSSK
jgi:hypothetical protein